MALGIAVLIVITMESPDTEWRRHLATMAVVMSWLNMMIFLSSTPTWGYFVQMFLKVSLKVLKVCLLLFLKYCVSGTLLMFN